MITYKKGDIFEANAQTIVHGCNCQGVMGRGVALAVKNKYPKVFESYQAHCKPYKQFNTTNLLLGHVLPVTVDDITIINAFTQDYFSGFGKHVSYDAVDECMRKIASAYADKKDHVISMPKIGAGLGGGSWPVIEAIITDNLKNYNIEIYEI